MLQIRQGRFGVLSEVPPVFTEPVEFKGVSSDQLYLHAFTVFTFILDGFCQCMSVAFSTDSLSFLPTYCNLWHSTQG